MPQSWRAEELDLIEKFFASQMTQLTLFSRIHQINPNRPYESITRKLRKLRAAGHLKPLDEAKAKLRVGYLDIEATHLNADFGYILSWYIKAAGKEHYDRAVITRDEILAYQFDRRVVRELLEALKNYDRIYTHYGADSRFDLPYVRTRAYRHGLEGLLPDEREVYIFDTWPIARNKLKLHSNRLGSIAEALGIEDVSKTKLSGHIWQMAAVGHRPSLQYIVKHNKIDVQLLERVHDKLKIVERPIYRSI